MRTRQTLNILCDLTCYQVYALMYSLVGYCLAERLSVGVMDKGSGHRLKIFAGEYGQL